MASITSSYAEEDYEETTAKYQTTYNWQRHPSFSSNYAGLNSMSSGADKMYTFSLTAHLGTDYGLVESCISIPRLLQECLSRRT